MIITKACNGLIRWFRFFVYVLSVFLHSLNLLHGYLPSLCGSEEAMASPCESSYVMDTLAKCGVDPRTLVKKLH